MAKAPSGGKDSGKARSAIKGTYVTKAYAKTYPKTTVVEHDRSKGNPKKPKK